jgi:diguanylate cyclase (GGDEF)-like protein
VSVALVATTGALGLGLTASANSRAESVLVAQRSLLQTTLASLAKQYLLFGLKEGLDFADNGTWALTPDNPADEARLESFVAHATFLNYGAALVTPEEQVLDSFSVGPGLPPPSDPGYLPMVRSLESAQPDISSVMEVGSVPVVAMGAPVEVSGRVEAVLVGFMRLDRSALEDYVEKLHYARTSQAYVFDSSGTVVAAQNPADIGKPLGLSQVMTNVAKGRGGNFRDSRHGTEVSFAPFGVGGWSGVTVESAAEFFGPISSGDLRIGLALLALLALSGSVIIVLGYRQESARRRFHELLAHQAYHDALTGLANRSLLNTRLHQAVASARRHGRGVALLYLDLDGFKPVNDREGHEVGDEVLVVVAGRLNRIVRAEDTVARVGGDEFAILMEEVFDPVSARQVAERVVNEVGRPLTVRGRQVAVGVSVGVAYSPDGEDAGEALLREADLAMYQAKEAGKSGYVFAGEPVFGRERP